MVVVLVLIRESVLPRDRGGLGTDSASVLCKVSGDLCFGNELYARSWPVLPGLHQDLSATIMIGELGLEKGV